MAQYCRFGRLAPLAVAEGLQPEGWEGLDYYLLRSKPLLYL